MEQLIIIFGMAVAVSFGVVLLAVILRAAITSSRTPDNIQIVNPTKVLQQPLSYDRSDFEHAVRGYDSPELFEQDQRLRSQSPSRSSPDDMF